MKAVRLHTYGHADKLKIEDIDMPKVHAGEVLVEVRAIGINPVDIKIREGEAKDRFPQALPVTVGQDFAGVIKKIGSSVIGYKVGDRVFGFAKGTCAEFLVAKTPEIAKIPKRLSLEDAAAIPTAGLTAWQLLVDYAEIDRGDRVLITGAGGGVGSFACQIAKAKGAFVIATASKDDFDYLGGLGVNQIIDYSRGSFESRISEPVDIVLDLIGEDTADAAKKILKQGGTLLSTVGSVKQQDLLSEGFNGGSMMMTHEGGELAELARMVDEGFIRPRISHVMTFEQTAEAQDLVAFGHPHGKVVLTLPDTLTR